MESRHCCRYFTKIVCLDHNPAIIPGFQVQRERISDSQRGLKVSSENGELVGILGLAYIHYFPEGSEVKNLPAVQVMRVLSLGREDPLEEEMETCSSTLAWKIP